MLRCELVTYEVKGFRELHGGVVLILKSFIHVLHPTGQSGIKPPRAPILTSDMMAGLTIEMAK